MILEIFLAYFRLQVTKGNDCFDCRCEPSLNFVYCNGYHITQWPNITVTDWINDLSFVDTLIQEFPTLDTDEFVNLQNLAVYSSPLISCNDIMDFKIMRPGVEIITDKTCFDSSTPFTHTMYSASASARMTSIDIIETTMDSYTEISTRMSTSEMKHKPKYILKIVLPAISMGLVLIAIVSVILIKRKYHSNQTSLPDMIEMAQIY